MKSVPSGGAIAGGMGPHSAQSKFRVQTRAGKCSVFECTMHARGWTIAQELAHILQHKKNLVGCALRERCAQAGCRKMMMVVVLMRLVHALSGFVKGLLIATRGLARLVPFHAE